MDEKEASYTIHGVTSPEAILAELARTPDIPDIDLNDYADVIAVLHDRKGNSFAQIVEYLQTHGIETNRTAVYRIYKKNDSIISRMEDELIDDETGEVVE